MSIEFYRWIYRENSYDTQAYACSVRVKDRYSEWARERDVKPFACVRLAKRILIARIEYAHLSFTIILLNRYAWNSFAWIHALNVWYWHIDSERDSTVEIWRMEKFVTSFCSSEEVADRKEEEEEKKRTRKIHTHEFNKLYDGRHIRRYLSKGNASVLVTGIITLKKNHSDGRTHGGKSSTQWKRDSMGKGSRFDSSISCFDMISALSLSGSSPSKRTTG